MTRSPLCLRFWMPRTISYIGTRATPREADELRAVEPRQVGGPELDRGRGLVRDERDAVAVEDEAALRGQAQRAERVRLRLVDVLLAGEHLQRPEAEEERREDREEDAAEDRGAEGELRRDAVRLDRRLAAARRPSRRGGRSVVVLAKQLHLGRVVARAARAQQAPDDRVHRRGQDEVHDDRRQQAAERPRPAGARSPSTKCTIRSPNEYSTVTTATDVNGAWPRSRPVVSP